MNQEKINKMWQSPWDKKDVQRFLQSSQMQPQHMHKLVIYLSVLSIQK